MKRQRLWPPVHLHTSKLRLLLILITVNNQRTWTNETNARNIRKVMSGPRRQEVLNVLRQKSELHYFCSAGTILSHATSSDADSHHKTSRGTQHARLTTQSYLSLINTQCSRDMQPSVLADVFQKVSSASLNMARWVSWWTALILHRGKRTFIFSSLTWVKCVAIKSSRSSDSFTCCLGPDLKL